MSTATPTPYTPINRMLAPDQFSPSGIFQAVAGEDCNELSEVCQRCRETRGEHLPLNTDKRIERCPRKTDCKHPNHCHYPNCMCL